MFVCSGAVITSNLVKLAGLKLHNGFGPLFVKDVIATMAAHNLIVGTKLNGGSTS